MSDKMREAAEQAYTMTAHDYCANPVGSRDWTLFWRGWQAARAEQPAQGEAVDMPKSVGHALEMSLLAGQYLRERAPELMKREAVDVLAEVDARRAAPSAPTVPLKPIGRIRRGAGFVYSLWCTADEMLALEPFPAEFPVYAAPPAPAVPDERPVPAATAAMSQFNNGWNACRAAMLAAAPEVPRG